MIDKKVFVPLNELTVLPGRKGAVLCRVVGEHIETLQELEFSFSNRHVLGDNRWLVALTNTDDTALYLGGKGDEHYIYRALIENDGTVHRFPDIKLPSHTLNQTLAIKGDVIYLGGFEFKKRGKGKYQRVNQGEMAGYMDLRLEEPVWHPLPLPVEMQEGKSIDDILVYGDKLVLVDNIMYPKYLFEYDISKPLAPVATKTINLPNNGTYEHIHRGSINNNWMALLSGGVGRAGSSQYVSVFSLPEYEQVLTVDLLRSSDDFLNRDKFTTLQEELEKARNTVSLNDFAIAGDNLLIACGQHGIGVFPLQELLKEYRQRQKQSEEDNEEDRLIRFRSFGSGYNLARIYKDNTHLRKVEGLEEVHTLIPQPDGRTIAVSYGETSLKLDYKMLDF